MMVSFGILELLIILIGVAVVVFVVTLARGGGNASKRKPLDPDVLFVDETLLTFIDKDRKINAIKYYREQTGLGLKASKEAVEYIMANRDAADEMAKGKHVPTPPEAVGAGVRDLIADGEIERAVEVYREFMGVDEYTARAAIAEMEPGIDRDEPKSGTTLS